MVPRELIPWPPPRIAQTQPTKMAENAARFSSSTNVNDFDIAENWVNIMPRPPNQTVPSSKAMEHPTSNVVDTINSLKEQVSQMAITLTNLKAHIGELETKMGRLENERNKTTCSE